MKILPSDRKTGRRQAVEDLRLPNLSTMPMHATLRPPPDNVNWYAAVGDWPLLLNDVRGDCVIAAAAHLVQLVSTYQGSPVVATDAEADAAYQTINHWTPNPEDEEGPGTIVLGTGGLIEYWRTTGLTFDGKVNRCGPVAKLDPSSMTQIRQGIDTFGAVLAGIDLYESMYDAPYIWTDVSGSLVSGHEILLVGYQTFGSGMRYYEMITWGERLRIAESVLFRVLQEAVVVIDVQDMQARGVDARNVPIAQLEADMTSNFPIV